MWEKVNGKNPFQNLERFCTISSGEHDEAMVLTHLSPVAMMGKVMPSFYKYINPANRYQLIMKSFENGKIQTSLTISATMKGISENHETDEHFACFQFVSVTEEKQNMLNKLLHLSS